MGAKTNKSMAKRFRVTKNGKLMHRTPNQNHFRAKKSSNRKRNIGKGSAMAKPEVKNILERMPFARLS
ncbi:MAG: 50S ribosomal protein L35 [bacterium]|nr:50S ribosomal protein L35 [bacterium]